MCSAKAFTEDWLAAVGPRVEFQRVLFRCKPWEERAVGPAQRLSSASEVSLYQRQEILSAAADHLQAEQGLGLPEVLLCFQGSCACLPPPPPKRCPVQLWAPAAEIQLVFILSPSATEVAEAFFDFYKFYLHVAHL